MTKIKQLVGKGRGGEFLLSEGARRLYQTYYVSWEGYLGNNCGEKIKGRYIAVVSPGV